LARAGVATRDLLLRYLQKIIEVDNILMTDVPGYIKPNYNELDGKVKEAIQTLPQPGSCPLKPTEWKECSGTCFSKIRTLVDEELKSTAYMLRAMYMSVLSVGRRTPIEFIVEDKLDGIWKNDMRKISVEGFETPGRLLMGCGPSASGKTYSAQIIINLLSEFDTNFPKQFFSIDGGIYREASVIYQAVVAHAKDACAAGFDNLVSAGISFNKFLDTLLPGYKSDLFDSGKIKNNIISFLEVLKARDKKISLYVPDTLGGCFTSGVKLCSDIIKKYSKLTADDNWIGLQIWQHKGIKDKVEVPCPYPPTLQCEGCHKSGTSRQITEGKKYDSGVYSRSIANGLHEVVKAPGGVFVIHNSGNKDRRSIFEDYTSSNPGLSQFLQVKVPTYNYMYVKRTGTPPTDGPSKENIQYLLNEEIRKASSHVKNIMPKVPPTT